MDSPWNSPGQNTGVGSRSVLQGVFPTLGLNPGLLHCRSFRTAWAAREACRFQDDSLIWIYRGRKRETQLSINRNHWGVLTVFGCYKYHQYLFLKDFSISSFHHFPESLWRLIIFFPPPKEKVKNMELACRLGAKRAFGRSSFSPSAPIARLLLEEERNKCTWGDV